MATDPDWTDPCAVHAWLNEIYPQVVAGGRVASTRHDGTEVTFRKSNTRDLAALMRQKYAECQASLGKTGRRAIIAG